MKLEYRPFAVFGFTFLTVLLLCLEIHDGLYAVAFAAGILLAFMSLIFKRVREKIVPLYVAFALLLSSALFYISYEKDLKYAQSFVGESAVIEGVIVDDPSYNSSNARYYYTLKLNRINSSEINTKLRLSLPHELEADVYDTVRLKATVYNIASDSADIKQYYNAKGIFLGAYSYNSEDFTCDIIDYADKSSVDYVIYSVNRDIKQQVYSRLPNEYGDTIIALLLGDKDNLSNELNDKFKEVGIAPVFAVSGLHLSIWIMGLFNLLSHLGSRRKINSVIGILFTIFFMLLTGLSPSVCRSGLMMILLLSGNLFYRKSDSLNSLGFAAFVLCLANPLIAADGSFLMSFAATLGIVVIYPVIDKHIVSKIPDTIVGKIVGGLISSIAVSISAVIGVFPVTVYQIGFISILTVFSNVLIVFFATIAMITGGLIAITYKIGPICDLFAIIAGWFTKIILTIVNYLAELSITTVSVDDIFWKIGTAVCVVAVVLSFMLLKGKVFYKVVSFSLVLIICTTALLSHFYYDNLTQLRLLDVGNGVSVIAMNKDRKILMTSDSDGYNMSSKIADNLNSISRIKTDLLLVGDRDGAYSSSTLEVFKNLDFDEIILPDNSSSAEQLFNKDSTILPANIDVKVWDNSMVLSVMTDKYSIAYCTFNDVTVLIVLDAYKYADIPAEYLQADYLISNGYIPNVISPEIYRNVFICGEEKYVSGIEKYVLECGGHPILVNRFDDIYINIREDSHKIYTMEG